RLLVLLPPNDLPDPVAQSLDRMPDSACGVVNAFIVLRRHWRIRLSSSKLFTNTLGISCRDSIAMARFFCCHGLVTL
ncbi:MAG: hypothetical protein KDA91_24935, partial [Planctomycetaceae bacterium]|nr:hypothetical protein [Planctomycetaceae bacterium]